MTALTRPIIPIRRIDELHSGDCMSADEFHIAYSRMPEDFKAELVEGVVYVASPLGLEHGRNHVSLNGIVWTYIVQTRGTEAGDNTTVRLGKRSEPQPDLFLRILPEYGGQSSTTPGDYVGGAPELIVEVAHSSRAIDLNQKRRDYQRNGVLEYLVLDLEERQIRWFDLAADQELFADEQGIIRVRQFPGLWLNTAAIIAGDGVEMTVTLHEGLASPEHAAFVAELAVRRKPV